MLGQRKIKGRECSGRMVKKNKEPPRNLRPQANPTDIFHSHTKYLNLFPPTTTLRLHVGPARPHSTCKAITLFSPTSLPPSPISSLSLPEFTPLWVRFLLPGFMVCKSFGLVFQWKYALASSLISEFTGGRVARIFSAGGSQTSSMVLSLLAIDSTFYLPHDYIPNHRNLFFPLHLLFLESEDWKTSMSCEIDLWSHKLQTFICFFCKLRW